MINKSTHSNENYLASVIKIQNIRKHSNADRLQCVAIYGNNVITGLTAKENDLYVYFPLESAISGEFLKYTNSFRDSQYNTDILKKGMFEIHGRVKAIRLRGEKSEGYIVPAKEVEDFCKNVLGKEFSFSEKHVGVDFDSICEHILLKKYVPANQRRQTIGNKNTNPKKKKESRLVDEQFHLHPDTAHLKRQIHQIFPEDYIAITNKLHGCNFVVSNVLTKRRLTFKEKIAKFFKVKVQETEYGLVYSSRKVVKNANFTEQEHNHFYDADVWKIVADKIYPHLSQGLSVTGEIVGYTPSGRAIQKNYDYGCRPGELDFWIFNVTHTSPCGKVYTFSHREMIEFCKKFNFKTPETYFYGKAKDLFPELNVEQHWHDEFLKKMMETYLEKKCTLCRNDVWAEGVILRKDEPFEWNAYKLKSFNFLLGETEQLDSGEIDLDSQENEETAE